VAGRCRHGRNALKNAAQRPYAQPRWSRTAAVRPRLRQPPDASTTQLTKVRPATVPQPLPPSSNHNAAALPPSAPEMRVAEEAHGNENVRCRDGRRTLFATAKPPRVVEGEGSRWQAGRIGRGSRVAGSEQRREREQCGHKPRRRSEITTRSDPAQRVGLREVETRQHLLRPSAAHRPSQAIAGRRRNKRQLNSQQASRDGRRMVRAGGAKIYRQGSRTE